MLYEGLVRNFPRGLCSLPQRLARETQTVQKHRKTLFATERPKPKRFRKTGTARTVPPPNHNRTEPALPELSRGNFGLTAFSAGLWGAESPEIPQKEGVSGSNSQLERASRWRPKASITPLHSQCSMALSCLGSGCRIRRSAKGVRSLFHFFCWSLLVTFSDASCQETVNPCL